MDITTRCLTCLVDIIHHPKWLYTTAIIPAIPSECSSHLLTFPKSWIIKLTFKRETQFITFSIAKKYLHEFAIPIRQLHQVGNKSSATGLPQPPPTPEPPLRM